MMTPQSKYPKMETPWMGPSASAEVESEAEEHCGISSHTQRTVAANTLAPTSQTQFLDRPDRPPGHKPPTS